MAKTKFELLNSVRELQEVKMWYYRKVNVGDPYLEDFKINDESDRNFLQENSVFVIEDEERGRVGIIWCNVFRVTSLRCNVYVLGDDEAYNKEVAKEGVEYVMKYFHSIRTKNARPLYFSLNFLVSKGEEFLCDVLEKMGATICSVYTSPKMFEYRLSIR